jgi:hypothetical protein
MAERDEEREATPVFEDARTTPSGNVVSVTVYDASGWERFPSGVKYSMHYGTTDEETILRYDNHHSETKGHERHAGDAAGSVGFPGYEELLARFYTEVKAHEPRFELPNGIERDSDDT